MGKYNNVAKTIAAGRQSWEQAADHGLMHIRTSPTTTKTYRTDSGHEFINMVSCSYLGLNRHPRIVQAAARAIEREGIMSTAVSRLRIAPALLSEAEAALSEVFRCEAYMTPSCFAASAAVLPVLASGHLTRGEKPFMIFDKHCHYSMNIMKGVCADETELATCAHNDVDFIEDACKRYSRVAYIADGAYSMGGEAPLIDLQRLQARYGLFLYFDDSHSISVWGKRGEGMIRDQVGELGDRTIIVGSLAKAFGATGGVIMLGNREQRDLLDYSSGPLAWSQMVNAAGLGAIKASAELHLEGTELSRLQARLRVVMETLDHAFPSRLAGNGLSIRVLEFADPSDAISAAREIYARGFYTMPLHFPIVAKDRSGLRIMGRADLDDVDLRSFLAVLKDVLPRAGEFLSRRAGSPATALS
jgi:7-keto-8-aminopelargonate synthetase-like enzyme